MQNGTLIQKRVVNGWFIRLVTFKGSYLVNAFAPNGAFYSQKFSNQASAASYFSFFCSKLSSGKINQGQLSLF